MSPSYSFTIININNLINNALKQREMAEAQRKIDNLCKTIGYRFIKTCNDCSEVGPKELLSILEENHSKKEINKFGKILKSTKGVRRLLREAYLGGVSCSHYAEGRWHRDKGLVFSREYQIKLAHKSNINGYLDLSLGNMEYHGYGDWDGREGILFEECKDKLGIPKDVVVKSLNLSQIMKNADI